MFLLPIMAVLVLAAFSVQERPRALRTFQPTQAYSGEQALAQVNRLAAVYPSRPAGEAADNDLARELADRFRAGSLEVSTQTDRIDTGTGDREAIRVTGRRAATGTGAIAVVAARDSVRPGARAELTATATLLELGALLGQRRIEHPVLLISVSGSLGQGGYRALARDLAGGEPLRAVIVLGTLGTADTAPPVTAFSNGPQLASLRLRRTLEESLRTERELGSARPSAAAQLARLAAPVTTGGQGPLLRAGLPAILLSTTGDRVAPAGVTPTAERLTADGRAVLRTIIAIDNAGPVDLGPEQRISIADGVIPGWAIRAIVLALLIPPALLVIDGLARARRERQRAGRWIVWVLLLALPQLLGVAAVALGARADWLDLPGGPIDPAVWSGDLAPLIVFAVVVLLGQFVLRPLLLAALGLRGRSPAVAAAPLGLAVVLVVLALVMWVFNPAAAAIVAPLVIVWPVLLDTGMRPARGWSLLAVILTLVPLALVFINLLTRFGLGDPTSALSWFVALISAGDVGLFPQLWFVALSGCCLAALRLAWLGHASDPDAEVTVRGPVTYAGPGSLGGVDSALERP